ncbi:proteasome subunit alpha type-3 [Cylas formicarius]|uniref:proteasome subunit alpha type-3 n=1 Tax=Cylas formicarius TaxID=197179 RepID=UPI00295864B5|nr:proteasome subunit alpha type-3 [Cylas formicarius]
MSSIGTGYDLSASQFSPDGRVFQVEYAMKAVENSGTVIGLKGSDGVVLAAEKLILSKLHEPSTNQRIFNIDRHIGMAFSGLIADARQIVQIARREAAEYRQQYNVSIPLKYLNERVSMYMHAYTLYSAIRPYGCSVILASYENGEPSMYTIDPSGVSYGYHGCATGKAKQSAKTEIEKLKLGTMTCKEIVKEAAKIIYLVHDELKDKNFELELSWVCKDSNGYHERVPGHVFFEAEKAAKQAMEADSESDTEDM